MRWSKASNRTPTAVMMSDFARCTEQAFLLFRAVGMPRDWKYAAGDTYIGAIALVIPREVWPNRPPTKIKWTTEVAFGTRTYQEAAVWSSMVYGLAGEAVLNFGPYPAPLSPLRSTHDAVPVSCLDLPVPGAQ